MGGRGEEDRTMTDERAAHGHDQEPVFQPDIEDLPASDYALTAQAVRELLIEKGVLTAEDIRARIEALDGIEPSLGGCIVARAWTDPAFKERLLENGTEAVREFDIDMGEADLVVVENTPAHHNLIVCTLCSCYPRQVLGLPPDWYKSRNYRARVVIEPRAVLREFGTQIPDQIGIRVQPRAGAPSGSPPSSPAIAWSASSSRRFPKAFFDQAGADFA